MINVAILGFGTIGSGVFEVIKLNADVLKRKVGDTVCVKHILDIKTFDSPEIKSLVKTDFEKILNDDEVNIMIEVMGGINVPYKFVKASLLKGKSVVTSNKALVAAHGPELLEIARKNDCNFLFEASVGGGIPIIRPLMSSLTADKILEIKGILNGTTNFILTEMKTKGKNFAEVLKEAQDLGFAEQDPTADIDGHDACRKIAILSSLAYGKTVNFEHIYTEGITKITSKDFEYAKVLDCEIKLLAVSRILEEGLCARVSPAFVSKSQPLASVEGVFNAVFVKGNVLGDSMFYGSGAGSLPTASAVVADVVDIIKNKGKHIPIDWVNKPLEVLLHKDVETKMLIRVAYKNENDAKKACEIIFGEVSFAAINDDVEFGVIVSGKEGDIANKIETLKQNDFIYEVISSIRFE